MDKHHILEEIKRTAEANGGAPLGRQRFLQETGIKDSDWLGKYWARWNDAIHEAGFSPNRLQGAFPDDLLLSKYISLVRELGRVPTSPDLRLKGRNDTDFPSHNTFARFGSKKQLLAKVVEYCRDNPGNDDVAALCEPHTENMEPLPVLDKATQPNEFGFVYLIKAGRYYKIGRTNALGRRERELAIQLPDRAQSIHAIRTDDPPGIEAYWHHRFESKRKNGEWFDLDAADVTAFRRRKFM
jgi:hypothetical protein